MCLIMCQFVLVSNQNITELKKINFSSIISKFNIFIHLRASIPNVKHKEFLRNLFLPLNIRKKRTELNLFHGYDVKLHFENLTGCCLVPFITKVLSLSAINEPTLPRPLGTWYRHWASIIHNVSTGVDLTKPI